MDFVVVVVAAAKTEVVMVVNDKKGWGSAERIFAEIEWIFAEIGSFWASLVVVVVVAAEKTVMAKTNHPPDHQTSAPVPVPSVVHGALGYLEMDLLYRLPRPELEMCNLWV